MNKNIHILLNFLKEHVNRNNKEIQLNQEEIEKVLSDLSAVGGKTELDKLSVLNRELQNENSDFIQLQLTLTEFLEKYRHIFPADTPETFSADGGETDVFRLTVSGKLLFNSAHPQYHNPRFFRELLDYYEKKEDYEMCDKLLKQRLPGK